MDKGTKLPYTKPELVKWLMTIKENKDRMPLCIRKIDNGIVDHWIYNLYSIDKSLIKIEFYTAITRWVKIYVSDQYVRVAQAHRTLDMATGQSNLLNSIIRDYVNEST